MITVDQIMHLTMAKCLNCMSYTSFPKQLIESGRRIYDVSLSTQLSGEASVTEV